MVLLIDNYDSFTFNLVQRFGEIDRTREVRVVRNDRIGVEEAERLLLSAVEAGARQKDSGELPAQALDMLVEAWGDAHQNLGVLELIHRRNPVRAREWFDKTVAIGPQPRVGREWVTQVALRACDALAQGQTFAPEDLDPRIALLE